MVSIIIQQRKKDKTWYFRIRRAQELIANKSGYSTKKEAQYQANQLVAKLQDGGKLLSNTIMLYDLYKEWLDIEILPSNLSILTKDKYIYYGKLIKQHFNKPLNSITPSFYQQVFNSVGQTRGRDYLGRLNRAIKQSVEFAIKNGALVTDFTLGVKLYSKKTPLQEEFKYLHRISEYKEVIEILKNMCAYHNGTVTFYLALLFLTGMRPAECMAVTWKDINFQKKEIISYRRYNMRTHDFVPPKTQNAIRKIPISDETMILMQKLRDAAMLQPSYTTDSLIFFHPKYKFGVPDYFTLKKKLRQILRENGIGPAIGLYGARHTRASYLISKGVSPDTIALVLGHTVKEFLETYRHLLKEIENEEYQKIREL